ncbi:MAG: AMIN domain-containing protein [Calothrix sp. SM1_7_51]|nr:AMIN domain-containing protein [Calothrix sp. SM1_7_51]
MDKKLMTKRFFRRCQHALGISLLSLYASVTTIVPQALAQPTGRVATTSSSARFDYWRFYPEAMQLDIGLSSPSQLRYSYLPEPSRIIVDLPNTRITSSVSMEQRFNGTINRIRVSQFNATDARLVMDISPGTFFDPRQVRLQPVSQNFDRWVLSTFANPTNGSFVPGTMFTPQPYNPNGGSPSGYVGTPLPPSPPPGYSDIPQPPNYQQPISQPIQQPGGFFGGVMIQPQPQPNVGGFPPSPNIVPQPMVPSPAIVNNSPQPTVIVPPLNTNPIQVPGNPVLPPASFPNQPGNFNSSTPFTTPGFAVPTINNPGQNIPSSVIQWGDNLPPAR